MKFNDLVAIICTCIFNHYSLQSSSLNLDFVASNINKVGKSLKSDGQVPFSASPPFINQGYFQVSDWSVIPYYRLSLVDSQNSLNPTERQRSHTYKDFFVPCLLILATYVLIIVMCLKFLNLKCILDFRVLRLELKMRREGFWVFCVINMK